MTGYRRSGAQPPPTFMPMGNEIERKRGSLDLKAAPCNITLGGCHRDEDILVGADVLGTLATPIPAVTRSRALMCLSEQTVMPVGRAMQRSRRPVIP